MTAPTRAPAAATLPPRILSAIAGVAGDGLVDGGAQRALVGDDLQAALLDDLVRVALAGEDALDDLAGQLVVEVAGGDQRGDPGDLLRA